VTENAETSARSRWGWVILIGGLALAGLLLSLADIAIGPRWPQPLASSFAAPARFDHPRPSHGPQTVRFEQKDPSQVYVIRAPIGLGVPLNPLQALRAFLSNGAGLVLLALAALLVFPSRARNSVERLEGRHGIEIALVTGVAMFLLALAAATLLRYTLVLLPIIPILLIVVMAAALFGIACISLATGRLLHRSLKLKAVHPLIAALAGALVVFDLAVIPYAGVFVLGAIALAGLGLAVVTRFGSSGGWSFRDLNW
jgi:MFS family permease